MDIRVKKMVHEHSCEKEMAQIFYDNGSRQPLRWRIYGALESKKLHICNPKNKLCCTDGSRITFFHYFCRQKSLLWLIFEKIIINQ